MNSFILNILALRRSNLQPVAHADRIVMGKIECIVRLGGGRQIVVKGHGENYCQAATDINWRQAYEFTIEDFLKNLETQLALNGF